MPPFSYATERKLKYIREQLGENWESQRPGKSIDSVYNELTGDSRKTLFCKIRPEIKAHLDAMTKEHNIRIAEFLEQVIEKEYARFQEERQKIYESVAHQYSDT